MAEQLYEAVPVSWPKNAIRSGISWTQLLSRDEHVIEAERPSFGWGDPNCTATAASPTEDQKVAIQPDPPRPTQLGQVSHEIQIQSLDSYPIRA
jgi:hypothetical protein